MIYKKNLVVAALGAAMALSTLSPGASAGGLYFSDRGVRPLSRGGAFVAGADDLGAIAYNPAGIYDAGGQFLIDGSWLHFTSDYTRQALVRQVDPNTGETVGTFTQTFQPVQGASPVLPIPTVAIGFQPHEQWVVAFGVWAPYAAITSYPELDDNGQAAPQRYSLLTLEGSALAVLSASAAFAPSKEFRLGASLQMLAGNFNSKVNFSGCLPERFFCAPEEPLWDVLAELKVGPIFAPSGNLGAIWIPHPDWRIGAAVQLPFYVRAPATLRTRLPGTPVFENAKQDGEDAHVAFDVPWTMRFGVETRAVENLRVEVGFAYDRWSMLDAITVNPDNIALVDVAGFPKRYNLPPVTLVKGFQDTYSIRAGGEYGFKLGGYQWDARVGVSYESSAIPDEYLSVQTIDVKKVTAALGASLHIGNKWRFDATYAHVFGFGVDVDPAAAQIAQVSPVAANPPKNPDYVNGGSYAARADVLGVGLAYTFAQPPEAFVSSKKAEPAPEKKPEPEPKNKKKKPYSEE